MAKKEPAPDVAPRAEVQREPAEVRYADQLEALRQNDPDTPPPPWRLSPRAVLTYIVGAKPLKAKINGKSVDVKIIDRGPYVDGRVIDLSKSAAARIGMKERGVAPVKVEARPSRQPTMALRQV